MALLLFPAPSVAALLEALPANLVYYWPGCSPSSSAAAAAMGGEQGSAAASYLYCPELSSGGLYSSAGKEG